MTDTSSSDDASPPPVPVQDLSDQINSAVAAAVSQMQVPGIIYGVVNSIQDGPPPSLTITLQGDSSSVTGIPFSASYPPVVGDTVLCFSVASDVFVVMTVADSTSGINGFLPGDLLETLRNETSRPGWLPRDGSTHNVSDFPALAASGAVVVSGSTFVTPNDVGLFMIGSGGSYSLGSTGGNAGGLVTLVANNLPSHTHANTATAATTVTIAPHAHTLSFNTGSPSVMGSGSVSAVPVIGGSSGTNSTTATATGATTVTMNNVANYTTNSAFSIMPPWRAVKLWIKT